MKKTSKPYIVLILFAAMLPACKSHTSVESYKENENIVAEKINVEEPTPVKVVKLNVESFNRELVANGKLEAVHKANLKFIVDGVIDKIHVREGDVVSNGQVLAQLNSLQQKRQFEQNKLKHTQAVLDYEDQLLRLGYQLKDSAKIDKTTKNIAKLRSGLSNAEFELKRARTDLSNTDLIAPFPGKIANLKARAYGAASSFDYFCTLIDNSDFEVRFSVLEQELAFIRASRTVTILPFNDASQRYHGIISSINPQIDNSGMLAIKANIRNSDRKLLDGESVSVIAQQNIPRQLVIPKSALLERQGRKVVFTVHQQKSYWNYVEIGYENSTTFAIKSGLKAGDTVIYDGNFNLAHEKPVKIIQAY